MDFTSTHNGNSGAAVCSHLNRPRLELSQEVLDQSESSTGRFYVSVFCPRELFYSNLGTCTGHIVYRCNVCYPLYYGIVLDFEFVIGALCRDFTFNLKVVLYHILANLVVNFI